MSRGGWGLGPAEGTGGAPIGDDGCSCCTFELTVVIGSSASLSGVWGISSTGLAVGGGGGGTGRAVHVSYAMRKCDKDIPVGDCGGAGADLTSGGGGGGALASRCGGSGALRSNNLSVSVSTHHLAYAPCGMLLADAFVVVRLGGCAT